MFWVKERETLEFLRSEIVKHTEAIKTLNEKIARVTQFANGIAKGRLDEKFESFKSEAEKTIYREVANVVEDRLVGIMSKILTDRDEKQERGQGGKPDVAKEQPEPATISKDMLNSIKSFEKNLKELEKDMKEMKAVKKTSSDEIAAACKTALSQPLNAIADLASRVVNLEEKYERINTMLETTVSFIRKENEKEEIF